MNKRSKGGGDRAAAETRYRATVKDPLPLVALNPVMKTAFNY